MLDYLHTFSRFHQNTHTVIGVYACLFDMLQYSSNQYIVPVTDRIHIEFPWIFKELSMSTGQPGETRTAATIIVIFLEGGCGPVLRMRYIHFFNNVPNRFRFSGIPISSGEVPRIVMPFASRVLHNRKGVCQPRSTMTPSGRSTSQLSSTFSSVSRSKFNFAGNFSVGYAV